MRTKRQIESEIKMLQNALRKLDGSNNMSLMNSIWAEIMVLKWVVEDEEIEPIPTFQKYIPRN